MSDLRGGRVGITGQTFRDESYERRLNELPLRDGWFVSSAKSILVGSGATVQGSTAVNRMHFLLLDDIDREVTASECRILVNTADAGSSLLVSVYTETDGNLHRLQGSEALFSSAATGQITMPVNSTFRFRKRHFLGFSCSSVTPRFSGIDASYAPLLSVPYMDLQSISRSPSSVSLNSLNSGSITSAPLVVYVSKEASRWL